MLVNYYEPKDSTSSEAIDNERGKNKKKSVTSVTVVVTRYVH